MIYTASSAALAALEILANRTNELPDDYIAVSVDIQGSAVAAHKPAPALIILHFFAVKGHLQFFLGGHRAGKHHVAVDRSGLIISRVIPARQERSHAAVQSACLQLGYLEVG